MTLAEGRLWEEHEFGLLEPVESLFDVDGFLQPYESSLLLERDLLPADGTASWLVGNLVADDDDRLQWGGTCQPPNGSSALPSLVPGPLPEAAQPIALPPGWGSAAPAATAASSDWGNLTVLPSCGRSDSEGNNQALLAPSLSALLTPTYTSLQQQQPEAVEGKEQPAPHSMQALQEVQQGQQQPRRRGRPRADRSHMTRQQLRAIGHAQAHAQRKKSHMHDLEERVADVRAELERERAQQASHDHQLLVGAQRAVAALERLLGYRDEMVAALREHIQGAQHVQLPARAQAFEAAADAPAWLLVSLRNKGQLKQRGEQGVVECFPLNRWEHRSDFYRVISDSASRAVVVEVRSVNPWDIVEGWREYAREAREVLAEFEETKDEEQAVSKLKPRMKRLGALLHLAMHHNPGCMAQLFLASADNLSDEQQREKYDAIAAAMELTPLQLECHLELAKTYDSLIGQTQQQKAEALARLGQSAHEGLPASASMARMMSRYLGALEGASELAAYPDVKFAAVVDLVRGMWKMYTHLQKARAAAMAYPHFTDVLYLMEAIKRLAPPEQRRQPLGASLAGGVP
ncbi:hypothetical protein N2152v2_010207 [Parachlorella kessleri]